MQNSLILKVTCSLTFLLGTGSGCLDPNGSAESREVPSGSAGQAGGIATDGGGVSGMGGVTGGTGGSTGGTGGSTGGTGGSTGGAGGTGGAPLPCDPGFSFTTNPAAVGTPFDASFMDSTPYANVDLAVDGPGSPTSTWKSVTGNGPYTWSWTVTGHGAGVLNISFVKDKEGSNPGETVASCQIYSNDNSGGTGGTAGSGGTGGTAGSGGGGTNPPTNRYGMGYVNEGNSADHDLSAALIGPGGFVTVIFAGITDATTQAEQSWKDSIAGLYARDLIPVIRMAPPWGNRKIRNMSDNGSNYLSYTNLAKAYRAVINDLPLRAGWPLYVQVHNEPNLCYEWECDSGTISGTQIAIEYAHFLNDVADELHAMNDPRIQVLNGALAPGGVVSCECGTSNFQGGATATDFLGQMISEIPGIFDKVDVFASHSYPAKGEGWGFFPPYNEAATGLKYFENELATIGKPNMKVLVTETGWTIQHEGYSHSREDVANFTVAAYENVWLTHPNILGITPFILRDSAWDKFAWTETNGNPYPVYQQVRNYRCSFPGAQNCQ